MFGAIVLAVQAAAQASGIDLAALFDKEAPLLLRQARRLAGPLVDAEDVVQDVFLVAQQKRHQLDGDLRPGAWLYAVMRNVILHHRRRSAKQFRNQEALALEPTNSSTATDLPLEQAQRQTQLNLCLEALTTRQRDVFTLFEFEGLSGAQIAGRLSISENAVYLTLTRSRVALKSAWSALGDEEQARMEGMAHG